MANEKRDANEGSIRRRPNGTWEGRVSLGKDPVTGKYLSKSFYGDTKSDVKRKIRNFTDELDETQEGDGYETSSEESQMTYGEWLDFWMKEYKMNSVSNSTYESYQIAIENHIKPILGSLRLIEIKPDHIQSFLNSRMKAGGGMSNKDAVLSSAYVIKIKNVVNGSLKQAVRNRMIPFNPTDAVTPPKLVEKKIRVFTPEEQGRYMSAIRGHRLEALFTLALATGMRKGELLALTWDNIDLKDQSIQIERSVSRQCNKETRTSSLIAGSTKSKAGERHIPMPQAIVPVLEAHQVRQNLERKVAGSAWNAGNLVFCSTVGGYIEPRRINQMHDKITERAGLEHINFHGLRHTFATRALENGVPAKVVQEILGHTDVSLTLNTYSHVLKSTAHDQIEKINSLFEGCSRSPEKDKDEPER